MKVLGEAYTPEDEEDAAVKQVTGLSIMQARYRVPLAAAGPGNWVLIEGIDASISKTATVVSEPMPVRGAAAAPPPLAPGRRRRVARSLNPDVSPRRSAPDPLSPTRRSRRRTRTSSRRSGSTRRR